MVGEQEEIGARIRQARESKGWSQQQLAGKVGMSQEAISKIETGQTRQPRQLRRIAKILEVSAVYLIGEEADPKHGHKVSRSRDINHEVDHRLLRDIVAIVEDVLEQIDDRMSSGKKADLIALLYEHYAGRQDEPISRDSVVRWVNFGSRR